MIAESELTDAELVAALYEAKESRKRAYATHDALELALLQRMYEKKAQALAGVGMNAIFDEDTTWDVGILEGLKEHIGPEIILTAYTAEHQETVPAKWDMRIVRSWGKFGEEVSELLDRAKIRGKQRVKIVTTKEPPSSH